MEKIGVIGLGNIAQKAYLPVMATLQDKYEWHLTTRNEAKGKMLEQKYGFKHFHQTLDQLIAEKPLAVFVHTPTKTHYQIIKQLLTAGINVYVDKPVSENLAEVEELYQLAEKKELLLTCGFNRRFAPFDQQLKQIADKRTIVSEKIRENALQPTAFAIFDLMIHSVDTAVYLMDEPIQKVDNFLVTNDGNLEQGYITLTGAKSHVQVITNMVGGSNLEMTTVQGSKTRQVVTNLNLLQTYQTGAVTQTSRPDWENTLVTRGFDPITRAFLKAVTNNSENPVSPKSAILSHKLCYDLVKTIKK
ncbi:putative oxidoreductase (putative) [Companilactobacillus paralimentarius DSM 13238 = JCM 10415]|uniref:Putative oxidoreductase (Putative) n=1 Tax=Companilactobacillus paralimentarius DSM 13238 = JCM 10415 TaxID=1122151 RepID=A0A0R1PHF7_9LACO|nr:Gfo/Idh/MocA family oxidoreductase [Companilactobacillus paralimentarius]KAE9565120.1 oxidoreductase [Companilactobacillus paralimentarius]KRL31612.1 putative oxidoreductase (putative) [Companilactobacillus paralimentarius DSM 13238 = JCM 10415]MDR4932784.1 Gfo/Idh/MocA family oxidoreductase [Companilactobacillus paralimentarius]QFR69339.1 gfo/Idh/MocA family oxidoreductase [Companilactobacillus paralimentarius]